MGLWWCVLLTGVWSAPPPGQCQGAGLRAMDCLITYSSTSSSALPPDLVYIQRYHSTLHQIISHTWTNRYVAACASSYLHSSHTTAPPPSAPPPTAQPTLWMSPIAAQLENRTAQSTHPCTHSACSCIYIPHRQQTQPLPAWYA